MAKYSKSNDVANQRGRDIERQLKIESKYPGGREQMIYDEVRAGRNGKLFIRPKY